VSYAQGTTVSVEKSKAEIERTLTKFGAAQFVTGWDDRHGKAFVQFDMNDRRIRFVLAIPDKESFRKYQRKNGWGGTNEKERTDAQVKDFQDQEMRRRWRALGLVVKAKLEAVETGISEFQEEFLAHIVIKGGKTIGEMILPQLDEVANSGRLPRMLPGKGET
jgi:hypothetical protein